MSKRSPEEKLLIGVLAQKIQDYMSARELTDYGFKRIGRKRKLSRARLIFIMHHRKLRIRQIINEPSPDLGQFLKQVRSFYRLKQAISSSLRKQKMLSHGQAAYQYIFLDDYESDNYVLGFNYICRYIGLDPKRLRDKIREIKQDQIKGIRKIATKRGKKP